MNYSTEKHQWLLFVFLLMISGLPVGLPELSAQEKSAHYEFKPSGQEDEDLIFTPPGFNQVGLPKVAPEANAATLKITVQDSKTGEPTFCRINVVGSDGNYYEPKQNYLTIHSLTGQWPNWPKGWGNRLGKAPIRYLGRYFYSWGKSTVKVIPGKTRIEIWKGFEYQPITYELDLEKEETAEVTLKLDHAIPMQDLGYHSGDSHVHIPRNNNREADLILDLMEAEDIHYGCILAYNDPAGPYSGFLDKMVTPQYQGIGEKSILNRDGYLILSGQEYRSTKYGHLNLFLDDDIVMKEKDFNADDWPPFGLVARETQKKGGFAFYAHGGYAQEIYADLVQGDINGVELLQFGVYRGIGLDDWYHILNCGFRFPIIGASDYPACRKLGDCKTFVHSEEKQPSFRNWLQGNADGESFVSTGPMILFSVNDKKPGHQFHPEKKETFRIKVKVKSVVAPVTHLQIVANGKIIEEKVIAEKEFRESDWLELEKEITLEESTWIAARAYSLSTLGTPDAEAHTNPVYLYFNKKAPYRQESLDVILEKLDGQMDIHRKREFPELAKVLEYFQQSRDILLEIRAGKGLPSSADVNALKKPDIDTSKTDLTEEELKQLLKPLPPKEPEEALQTFESPHNFSMQVVAAEPLVHDPIAACFDEKGNLYVTEMLDYPYHPVNDEKPIGTVRLLRDTDHDGRFDKSTVFAEELLWAGGVVPWKGGVYIAAPPDIWYMKDTDGDDKADIKRKVFTGFGSQNQQAMVNNLKFGLDHKIYGSTAGNGGEIITVAHPDKEPIRLNGMDFCFDPVTEEFETVTGTVQFGNTFDDWGNRFMCSQGVPGRHELLPHRYLKRNPYLVVSGAIETVAPAGIQIYRTSPIEAWRKIRVARRRAKNPVKAASTGSTHHVIDASAGTTVYRGTAYPEEFYGNLFIGCGQNNLVHRRKLIPDGISFKTERIEYRNEFIRSTDIWFRPVNFVNAPDGTLYCLDMSREFLESIHIPLDVVKHLDLVSGRDRGRIYRMAPPGFQYPGSPEENAFGQEQILQQLQNRNGWWRDTAHRLIYETQDFSLVPELKKIAVENEFPQARLHALWSLQGLNSLDENILLIALSDSHPRIREHAIRLSEPFLDKSESVFNKVITLKDDSDPRVRFQLAFSLGETGNEKAIETLAEIAIKDSSNSSVRTAILSSIIGKPDNFFVSLWNENSFRNSPDGITLLKELVRMIGSRNQEKEIVTVLKSLAESSQHQESGSLLILETLAESMIPAGSRLDTLGNLSPGIQQYLDQFFESSRNVALQSSSHEEKSRAIKHLSFYSFKKIEDLWKNLIQENSSPGVRNQVIQLMETYPEKEAGQLLLDQWEELVPEQRTLALTSLLANEESTLLFLKAARDEQVSLSQLNTSQQAILLKHRNRNISELAGTLISQLQQTPRSQIALGYQEALKLKGNQDSGKQVFTKNCSICHQVGNIGQEIGPNLMTTLGQDLSMFITHVMDPNRYVPPDFIQYMVIDQNGKTWTGMISEQTATSMTLKENKDKSHTILLNQVDEMTSTGKSLMPEGLEKNVSVQEMADLIAFLNEHKKQLDQKTALLQKEKEKEIGTEPGLVAPGTP